MNRSRSRHAPVSSARGAQSSGDDDDYEEYVPLKRRRDQEAATAAAAAAARGAHALARAAAPNRNPTHRDAAATAAAIAALPPSSSASAAAAARRPPGTGDAGAAAPSSSSDPRCQTLLDHAAQLQASFQPAAAPSAEEAMRAREAAVLAELSRQPALRPAAELAAGVEYTDPMPSSWRPPRYLRAAPPSHHDEVRRLHRILVEGDAVPPPCVAFAEMRLPLPVRDELAARGIANPTPIQMQGLPVALAGRDMIGIAFTGSGKTLVFTLPLVLAAWEAELRLPFRSGEGPAALILAPSRELARQTFDIASAFCKSAARSPRGPTLRAALAIGGVPLDLDAFRKGLHVLIATPGRLLDLLRRRRITLDGCIAVALDEADRLIDLGFEEDIRNIFSFFSAQRQTLMFSATMPTKIQAFAASALVKPIVVNVGRAGAASLNISQHVEVVRQDARISRLLDVLQKTAPPVLIFCRSKSDVDEVHEYLLDKGVAAVSVHGGRDQEDRESAVRDFRSGSKDVLVATDVAAKGLDFPCIHHVINYDMPKEIQTYVHRIGRTGRGDHTGTATTFVSSLDSPTLIADLVQLMLEAKQKVPETLYEIVPDLASSGLASVEVAGVKGCAYCGGFGHRVEECPTLESEKMKALVVGGQNGGERFNRGGFGGEW